MVNTVNVHKDRIEHKEASSIDIVQGFLLDDMKMMLIEASGMVPDVYWSWVAFYLWCYVEGQTGDKYAQLAYNSMYLMFRKLRFTIGYRVTPLDSISAGEMKDLCYCSQGAIDTDSIRLETPSGSPGEIQYSLVKKCIGVLLSISLL